VCRNGHRFICAASGASTLRWKMNLTLFTQSRSARPQVAITVSVGEPQIEKERHARAFSCMLCCMLSILPIFIRLPLVALLAVLKHAGARQRAADPRRHQSPDPDPALPHLISKILILIAEQWIAVNGMLFGMFTRNALDRRRASKDSSQRLVSGA